MTPQSFLAQARDIDLDVRFIDALLERALADAAHPKLVSRLLERRAAAVSTWGRLWATRPVETAQ